MNNLHNIIMTTDLYQSLIEGDDISSKKQKDDYLTEKEVAKEYPIYTSNSLRFYRSTNRSLFPFHKIGRKVLYKREDMGFGIKFHKKIND